MSLIKGDINGPAGQGLIAGATSSAANLVTIDTDQTITGDKTLTGDTTLDDTTISTSATNLTSGSISNTLRFTDVSGGPSINAVTGGTSASATVSLHPTLFSPYRFTDESLSLPTGARLTLGGNGGITLDQTGNLQFGFGGVNEVANRLDDYEEGTWTPILPAGLVAINTLGAYTKIGNTVQISFTPLSINGTATTAAAAFEIGGLPFAVSTGTPGIFHSTSNNPSAAANLFDGGFAATTTLLRTFRNPGSQITLLNSGIANFRSMTIQLTYKTTA